MNIVKFLQHILLATSVPLLLCSYTLPRQMGKLPDDRKSRLASQMLNVHRSDSALTVSPSDSLFSALSDSSSLDKDGIPDSTGQMSSSDSLELLGKSSLERPAFSTAKDSIIEDFSEGKQMIYYYGEVTVTYGDMKLTADYMEYDLNIV